jgi:uncharacterized protein
MLVRRLLPIFRSVSGSRPVRCFSVDIMDVYALKSGAMKGDGESAYQLGLYLLNNATEASGEEEEDVGGGEMNKNASSQEELAKKVILEIRNEQKAARARKRAEKQKNKNRGVVTVDESVDLEEDASHGIYWLRKASRTGHVSAMVLLGNHLLHLGNDAPEKDETYIREALFLYNKAAKINHPDALFNLGTLYFSGIENVLPADLDKSRSFFEKSAALGDAASLYWVAHCMLSTEGGFRKEERDVQKALSYLHAAAKEGHAASHYRLAMIYREGLTSDAIPLKEGGDIEVQSDGDKFVYHLEQALEGENEDAYFAMAILHLQSQEQSSVGSSNALVPYPTNPDIRTGVSLLEKAVELGHTEALVSLGAVYYNGLYGYPQNKRRSFELYNQAAERGSKDAWMNLASMYYQGDGVPKNKAIAESILKNIFGKE